LRLARTGEVRTGEGEKTLRPHRPTLKFAAPVVALGLLFAGCSSDDTSGGETSGSINISGSSTVEPISSRVAELFDQAGNTAEITVDGPGTGDGFEVFCAGETDVSDASRPISAEEVADCAANNIEFIELKIGFDGIAVITNPANTSVQCLSFADLYALVGPESEGFGDWSDAQALATELGSSTTLPSGALDITAPGTESGTYDSFIEIALADIAEERVAAGKISEDQAEITRSDYTSQANDNAILQAIEGSDTSFGWVGFAFAEEAGDQVKELSIAEAPGGECVAPTAETIADGSYPLSRSLYIYVNKANAENNSALADYVDFYLGDGYVAVGEVGYVPLPESELSATEAVWTARTVGTRDGGE
jgi:phosphate transport system substrate-binding protein